MEALSLTEKTRYGQPFIFWKNSRAQKNEITFGEIILHTFYCSIRQPARSPNKMKTTHILYRVYNFVSVEEHDKTVMIINGTVCINKEF